MTEGSLVTIQEAMDALACSRSKIYSLGKEGRLTVVRFDGRSRVTAASLKRLLKNLLAAATSDDEDE